MTSPSPAPHALANPQPRPAPRARSDGGDGASGGPMEMETIKLKGYDSGTMFVGGQINAKGTPTTGMYSGDADWKSFSSTVYGTGKDNPIKSTGLLDALCANREPALAGGASGCDCYLGNGPASAERACADGTAINSACAFKSSVSEDPNYPCRKREEERCADGSMTNYARCIQASKSVSAVWLVSPSPAPPPSCRASPACPRTRPPQSRGSPSWR